MGGVSFATSAAWMCTSAKKGAEAPKLHACDGTEIPWAGAKQTGDLTPGGGAECCKQASKARLPRKDAKASHSTRTFAATSTVMTSKTYMEDDVVDETAAEDPKVWGTSTVSTMFRTTATTGPKVQGTSATTTKHANAQHAVLAHAASRKTSRSPRAPRATAGEEAAPPADPARTDETRGAKAPGPRTWPMPSRGIEATTTRAGRLQALPRRQGPRQSVGEAVVGASARRHPARPKQLGRDPDRFTGGPGPSALRAATLQPRPPRPLPASARPLDSPKGLKMPKHRGLSEGGWHQRPWLPPASLARKAV